MIYFSAIIYQILKRRRQRINLIFSGYYLSSIIGFIFNMCYAAISPDNAEIIIFLHFLSGFFVYFSIIFLLIVNLIFLESTVIFSVKRQNRFIFLFGVILFFGMLILILIPDPLDIIGVSIAEYGRIRWKPVYFTYIISIVTGFAIIPLIYTSFKIYFRFETKALKKKWLFYLIGSIGLVLCNLYPIYILNLLTYILPEAPYLTGLRSILSILGISVIIWAFFMYYGIGFKLKK